ncbi:MAG: NAD+ synthase [Rhodothermaceae bacterium]|nr:NAD+ synthase [Rhodothermaceae bacterium]
MRLALCQFNPTVGDLAGNVATILAYARRAAEAEADLAIFTELCVTGYPPQDLLDRSAFIRDVETAVAHLAAEAPEGLGLLIGAPVRNEDGTGKRLYNAALLIDGDEVVDAAYKTLLPTYDVFDEYRYFEPCPDRRVVSFRGLRLGLHICEDMWNNEEQAPYHLYAANPIDELAALGIDLFVNISASPFALGKPEERTLLIQGSCREHGVPFVYVNQVGANTELIFDGDSRVHDTDGTILWRARLFEEAFHVWDMDDVAPPAAPVARPPAPIAQIHDALVLGIRDYVEKTGAGVFEKTLVGLSGGIDSAVTCALAVEALGPERVVGITMPSKYSSAGSVSDSETLAANLGIDFHDISIRPAVDAFGQMLAPLFAGTEEGIAEENIQARARGVTLMAVSNKFGYLLLTTGNKSEMAVGYATLYGDMSGGLAVLSDVFKTQVYALARYINERAGHALIPENTITKPPSAELKPGQVDQDSLPPYAVLDQILLHYVEEHLGMDAIVGLTRYDRALVERVARMVDRNEYKRRQAAPGLRVSPKAFGVGRRVPIVMQRTRVAEPEVTPAAEAPDV